MPRPTLCRTCSTWLRPTVSVLLATIRLTTPNKRTAASATVAFLRLNGTEVRVGQMELADVFVSVASGGTDEEVLAVWLRRQVAAAA